ncbi:hypothetical protein [Aestuariivirga sp.]|uniref:hypothetical protein n=1 Tax=Aestuariivirga sp. TaxID=2650926 RepID=UPI00391D933D
MTARKLPPLLVGVSYRSPLLTAADFSGPDLARELAGEVTAVLRLRFANGTELEVPARAFQLQMLMGSLMRSFPQQALAQLRHCPDDDAGGPDQAQGEGR